MQVIILILATLLTMIWLILFYRASSDDISSLLNAKIFNCNTKMLELLEKEKHSTENLSRYKNLPRIIHIPLSVLTTNNLKKQIKSIERNIATLQKGKYSILDAITLPGHVVLREYSSIVKGSVHKTILSVCTELYGRKYAPVKTIELFAKFISYPILGIACILSLGSIFIATSDLATGLVFIGVGVLIVLVLVYAIYDDMKSSAIKRRTAISKQFPNVVSKLALLVTSGMIMDKAWKETALSNDDELYQEMKLTTHELDNLVSPEVAYSNFISRCNTKETAKLASAILQNLSKGNAEIGRLLKTMAHEAWQERRHTAKRDAEKANSKLMIPTMLLFLAILMMLMVPIAMNFTGI